LGKGPLLEPPPSGAVRQADWGGPVQGQHGGRLGGDPLRPLRGHLPEGRGPPTLTKRFLGGGYSEKGGPRSGSRP